MTCLDPVRGEIPSIRVSKLGISFVLLNGSWRNKDECQARTETESRHRTVSLETLSHSRTFKPKLEMDKIRWRRRGANSPNVAKCRRKAILNKKNHPAPYCVSPTHTIVWPARTLSREIAEFSRNLDFQELLRCGVRFSKIPAGSSLWMMKGEFSFQPFLTQSRLSKTYILL